MKYLRLSAPAFAGLLLLVALTINLDRAPAMLWDEGWTVLVARNWVELGHYGKLSLGEKAPAGLQAAFPVTGFVALAFKCLGIGLIQARLVITVYLLGTLALLFYLACRFYDRRVAVGTLLVLLLCLGNRFMHPLIMGRQVFGELPALFFLTAGYAFLFLGGERSRFFFVGLIFFLGLGVNTKAQVLPFFFSSFSPPLILAMVRRRRKLAAAFWT